MPKTDLYELIDDRLEGWELADMLGLTALDICLQFEDKIYDKIEELKELLALDDDYEDEEIDPTDIF